MRTVILPIESSRSSGRELLRGIAQYSRLHGPWTFYWEPGGVDEVFARLKNLNADGIIMRDAYRLDDVLQYGFPVIVVGHYLAKHPELVNITPDSMAIGKLAADHLLQCGFRHFGFCGFDDRPWSTERCKYFVQCIEEEGYSVQVYKQPYVPRKVTWQKEQKIMVKWLQSLPKPLGLFATNDDRCQQALQACKIAGIQVPEDIAIIGADNDELICGLSDPPLSSVSINFERAGYEGAAMLDRLMQGNKDNMDDIIIHATHVVIRQSTDFTCVDDPYVAQAVRYIRQHSKENISVDDVVDAVPLSRRVLEKRFADKLNRSILNEIRRVRTNLISQMLVETNLSVSQIADALDFQGDEHISRYFRMEKKLSPLQFRKRFGQK